LGVVLIVTLSGAPSARAWRDVDDVVEDMNLALVGGRDHGPRKVEGVSVSADRGCSWQVTLDGQIVDVVVRRDDPHSALAIVSSYSERTDAGASVYATQVFATHDDGAHWSAQGLPVQPDVAVETLDIAMLWERKTIHSYVHTNRQMLVQSPRAAACPPPPRASTPLSCAAMSPCCFAIWARRTGRAKVRVVLSSGRSCGPRRRRP
jgi:hypothetical protein